MSLFWCWWVVSVPGQGSISDYVPVPRAGSYGRSWCAWLMSLGAFCESYFSLPIDWCTPLLYSAFAHAVCAAIGLLQSLVGTHSQSCTPILLNCCRRRFVSWCMILELRFFIAQPVRRRCCLRSHEMQLQAPSRQTVQVGYALCNREVIIVGPVFHLALMNFPWT